MILVEFADFTLQVQGLKALLAVLICLGDEQFLRQSDKNWNIDETSTEIKSRVCQGCADKPKQFSDFLLRFSSLVFSKAYQPVVQLRTAEGAGTDLHYAVQSSG